MPDPSRSYRANGYWRISKGTDATLRSTSVYQNSRYPSSDRRIENALPLHSGGTNTCNAFGIETRHPGGGGAITVGTSLATIAACFSSSAKVGSINSADLPSRINDRTGSIFGSVRTCSSDSSLYLPASKSRSQALSRSTPWSHWTQSDKSFGIVTRLYVSAVTWTGVISGAICPLVLYRFLPEIDTCKHPILSRRIRLSLTFTGIYRKLNNMLG